LRSGPSYSASRVLIVSSAILISFAGAAAAAVRPVKRVVAEIPDGHFVASDLFTGRPMIDFSDDFRQSVWVESSLPDSEDGGAKARVVFNGKEGPWYEQIEWYDSDVLADRPYKKRYRGFLGDHFYYLAHKRGDADRERLILDGTEYGPYVTIELPPTYDDAGRIVWVARSEDGTPVLYAEGGFAEVIPERQLETLFPEETESPDAAECAHWRPASGIARFDAYAIEAHCLYLVPTAPVEPITWWLALDGEPISEDFEMIGKVVVRDDEVEYGVLDRDKLLVVKIPLGQPLTFDDPPLEFDFRTVRQAVTTQDETLSARVSHDELGRLCRDHFRETE